MLLLSAVTIETFEIGLGSAILGVEDSASMSPETIAIGFGAKGVEGGDKSEGVPGIGNPSDESFGWNKGS